MKPLFDIFSESNGQLSSMRVMSAYVVVNTMLTWTYAVIQAGAWVDPTWNMIALIFGALGVKTWQKKYEDNCCGIQDKIQD